MNKAVETPSSDVERLPAWIKSRDSHLAAWIHRASDKKIRNGLGLLICNPVGHELIHAYQSIREIADSYARAGFSVLRFDYSGTGDSEGDEFSENTVENWIDDIGTAAIFLQDSFGVDVTQLLGIRSGAILAAARAQQLNPTDGLILWDPFPSGKRFIRELKANEKMAYFRSEPELFESVGFPYTDPVLEALGNLDISSCLNGFEHPVVAVVRDKQPVPAAIQKIGDACASFSLIQTPGLATMLIEPHNAVIPSAAIRRLLAWSSEHIETATAEEWAGAKAPPSKVVFAAADEGVIEEVVQIGDSGTRGILCHGSDKSAADRPIVLFGNAGSIYHIGPNRLYVTLSRRLAQEGYASLRYDLPNIGDGLQFPHPEANHPYPSNAVECITEVIDFSRNSLGYASVILTGFCSGATQAFLAAMHQGPTAALIETAMVNPKVFYVEDIALDSNNRIMQRASYYSRAVVDKDRWRRLLTGKIDYRQLFRFLSGRITQQFKTIFRRVGSRFGMAPSTRLGRDIVTYLKTGRRLSFFFSSRDPGLRVLLESSDGVAKRLIRKGELPVAVIEDADHTMIAKRCRDDFTGKFIARMKKVYPTG